MCWFFWHHCLYESLQINVPASLTSLTAHFRGINNTFLHVTTLPFQYLIYLFEGHSSFMPFSLIDLHKYCYVIYQQLTNQPVMSFGNVFIEVLLLPSLCSFCPFFGFLLDLIRLRGYGNSSSIYVTTRVILYRPLWQINTWRICFVYYLPLCFNPTNCEKDIHFGGPYLATLLRV